MDNLAVQQGPRRYKSRLNRPCDLCRSRKIACRIDIAPPCAFCLTRGIHCTFLQQPRDRPRRTSQPPLPYESNYDELPSPNPPFDAQISAGQAEPSNPDEHVTNGKSHRNDNEKNRRLVDTDVANQEHQDDFAEEDAILGNLSSSARLLSDLGHLNRFLLHGSSASLMYRDVPGSTYRQVKLGNATVSIQDVFEIPETAAAASSEHWAPQTSLSSMRAEVDNIISDKQGERLVKLYFDHVYPALPILSRSWFLDSTSTVKTKLRLVPVSLLASLCATTLPFIFNDEYLNSTMATKAESSIRNDLYRIAWQAISTEANAPSLSTLQACLLLLQHGPTNQYLSPSPFHPAVTKFAVSLAATLGLNRDCSSCISLSLWERRLRARLWWMTYITDAWAGIESSTVGSIRPDDFDVPLPQSRSDARDGVLNLPEVCEQFCGLVHLTHILLDIQAAFYSVKATEKTSRDLFHSLEIARPIHARLVEWKSKYTTPDASNNAHSTNGVAFTDSTSLSLCYYAVTVTVLRALMRPLENAAGPGASPDLLSSATNAVLTRALSVVREALAFIEHVVALRSPWNSFWYSWAQMNFANMTMFVVQLHLDLQQQPEVFISAKSSENLPDADDDGTAVTGPAIQSEEARDMSKMIKRWRQAIRLGVGSGGWGGSLMSLALLRMDAFLAEAGDEPQNSVRIG